MTNKKKHENFINSYDENLVNLQKKLEKKRKNMTDFWKNTDINDLEGEEWKDVVVYVQVGYK